MNKAEELKPKSKIAFVTELTRAARNTDLDDPIQFAAFRQVAEEKVDVFVTANLNSYKSDLVKKIEIMIEFYNEKDPDVDYKEGEASMGKIDTLKAVLSIITKEQ